MKIFAKLFKRELKLFFSNSVAVFIFFAAPIGYGLMVGSAYSLSRFLSPFPPSTKRRLIWIMTWMFLQKKSKKLKVN